MSNYHDFPLTTFKNNQGKENENLLNDGYSSPKDSLHQRNGNAVSHDDEKELFLNNSVRLDPGWEQTDRDPEELNFKKQLEDIEQNEPRDRWRLVFFIMLIHGVGILMPWNMFINAKAYFEDYKLDSNVTEVVQVRQNFMSYIGIAAQIPNVLMSGVNAFCHCTGQPSPRRIAISIAINIIVFIVTVILAMVDSTEWPMGFFGLTLLSVIIQSMCTGIYQNCVYGQAAILPMKYTNAVVLGNNLCGTFTAVVNIITIASAPSPRTAAIYYFVAAIVVLLVAFDAYFILPLTRFYKHFSKIVHLKQESLKKEQKNTGHKTFCQRMQGYWSVVKQIWVQIFCIFWIFFVTLAIFPAVWSNIKRNDFPISDTYWAPIFCFLNFNLFAFLGNLVSEFIKVPGPRFVWIPVLLRGLFIPFFLMCNFNPASRTIPVIITNDYVYIIGSAVMAFTGGYFSSLCMMYGPKQVNPEVAGVAGMLMGFFLVMGITIGVNFSLVLYAINSM
ncbi:hypothetical protein ScPMuIL_001827 [Solemya velum]